MHSAIKIYLDLPKTGFSNIIKVEFPLKLPIWAVTFLLPESEKGDGIREKRSYGERSVKGESFISLFIRKYVYKFNKDNFVQRIGKR